MPNLDWQSFAQLPGDPRANWESLCGAVVRRSFGSLGRIRYRSQQPGVEFHLKVERASSTLGESDRWWGWQCRWYDLEPGKQLGKSRRDHIEDAIRKTERHVPGITDWVLWTRRPLTPVDQKWFEKIESEMTLCLWTEEDLNAHLVGDAEYLRRTYFGDLILTPDELIKLRDAGLAPVRQRWLSEANVGTAAEVAVRSLLGEPQSWRNLNHQVNMIELAIDEINVVDDQLHDDLSDDISELVAELTRFSSTFGRLAQALAEHDWSTATHLASSDLESRLTRADALRVGRALRRVRHPASIPVQAAYGWHYESTKLLANFREVVFARLAAVVGSAGFGKTHLAAELSAPGDTRPGGLYLPAWPVSSRGNLNETLPTDSGAHIRSFEDLLEAVDAAGARSASRIPIFIDGLNESEDPLVWTSLLASLHTQLEKYRNVLVIVTLRSDLTEDGLDLPEQCVRIQLEGFSELTGTAVQKYFEHYRIKPGDVRLPLRAFTNPLFLRMFCEATNPTREHDVTAERVPASFHAVFELFRTSAVTRLSTQPGGRRWSKDQIRGALDKIAMALWSSGYRAITFGDIQGLIGDEMSEWTQSLTRALRHEGLLGVEDGLGKEGRTVFLYDSFAGFMIADALSKKIDRRDFSEWIRQEIASGQLQVDPRAAHPLADDIRKAFVALAPRKFGTHVWQHIEGPARFEALVEAAHLERQFLDRESVEAIAQVTIDHESNGKTRASHRLFDRLYEIRDIPYHPLNGEFLDTVLIPLHVADRDLIWTEWVRSRESLIVSDLASANHEWQAREERTPQDRLGALWLKWMLTSTLRELRDLATRGLYWYGRGDPKALFDLTVSSVESNDPYIAERIIAAAYGVMMAAPGERRVFGEELPVFLDALWNAYCSDRPKSATDHWLIREYVDGIVGVGQRYYPSALGKWQDETAYAAPSRPRPIGRDDPRQVSANLVHGSDFENYTVGRLVPGRRNYDYQDPRFEEVLSWIRARVWQLGWRSERFRALEEEMSGPRGALERRGGRMESYRKKYGWIGFYEAAGRLESEGRSPLSEEQHRLSDMDIDPSFPVMPEPAEIRLPNWLSDGSTDLRSWMTKGTIEIPDHLLRTQNLANLSGPWLATSGYLEQQDENSQRRVFAILRAFLVPQDDLSVVRQSFSDSRDPAWLSPTMPESAYIFVGEVPWNPRARSGLSSENLNSLYSRSARTAEGRNAHIELIDHHFRWITDPMSSTAAGEHSMPAATLADSFDLRAVPNSLDWCDATGQRASIVLSAPPGCRDGHLLYMRENLIREYCAKRGSALMWIIYGERETWSERAMDGGSKWLREAYADNENVWSRVVTLDELTAT